MENKKKGFTIIELLCALSILSILFSFSMMNFSGFNKLQNKIDVDVFNNSLINFINYSKEYCREENVSGYIYFDIEKGFIYLVCGIQKINQLQLPQNFTLNIVRPGNKIKIDNRGMTEDACTIQFKDREGKIHYSTMCVGTAFVEIKN